MKMMTRGNRGWSRWIALSAVAALFCAPAALAQDDADTDWDDYEYETDEGLHEQEWYDPSDWFDTDNGIDYEYDYDPFYSDYDYYDPYYYDPYYDSYGYYDDYYDPYVYDPYYDPYYRYTSPTADNTTWYGVYYGWDDTDNNQRNRNQADRQNRNRTNQQMERNRQRQAQQRQAQQKRMQQQRMQQKRSGQRIQGELVKTTTVDVFGKQHVLAKVRKSDGKSCVIDLGPKGKVSQLDLSQGDTVRIQGRRGMMAAGRIHANDESVTIDRKWAGDRQSRRAHQTQGTIESLRTRTRDGEKQLIAYLEQRNGSLQRVNLGSKQHLQERGLDLEEGDRIQVRGAFGREGRSQMVTAEQIRKLDEGESYARGSIGDTMRRGDRGDRNARMRADRNARMRGQRNRGMDSERNRRFSGEVTDTWTERRDGERHMFVTVELDDGREMDVDPGVRDQLEDVDIARGDDIRLRGSTRTGQNGESRIVASGMSVNGSGWQRID